MTADLQAGEESRTPHAGAFRTSGLLIETFSGGQRQRRMDRDGAAWRALTP